MGLFSFLFRGGDSGKPANRLAKFETIAVNGPSGPTHGIVMSVNAPDASTFGALMPEIVATFRNQRMISPPDTSFLLITIIGDVTSAEFKQHWDSVAKEDQGVQFFLSQMTKADALHGQPDGTPLDSVSLLS